MKNLPWFRGEQFINRIAALYAQNLYPQSIVGGEKWNLVGINHT